MKFEEFIIGSEKLFIDRKDALLKLYEFLPLKEMINQDIVVVPISSGGVYLANDIAKKINGDFDFLFTEAIHAPNNPECEIAMVSETEEIVVHEALVESFDIQLDFIYGEAHRKYEEKIINYIYKYRKGQMINSVKNRKVLLVDEGIDTALTALTCAKTMFSLNVKSLSIATPVIPYDVFMQIDDIVDDIYCVYKPYDFVSVKHYYENLESVDAKDIHNILTNNMINTKL